MVQAEIQSQDEYDTSEVDDVGDNKGKETLVSFLIRKAQRSTVLE